MGVKFKVLVPSLALMILTGCGNSTSFDGNYVVNKEKSLNSSAIKEIEELSPMMANLQKMLLAQMLSAAPKMIVQEGVLRVGVAKCNVSSDGSLDCGSTDMSGSKLAKTDSGVVLSIMGDDSTLDLYYDKPAE